jgi:hypothetical protein
VTTLAGLEVPLDLEEFLDAQGEALRRPAMREAAARALAAAGDLIEPAVVYDWFPVGDRSERKVQVGDVVFELGRHADLLAPANEAFLAVVTIGPELEARSRDLQAAGRALDSFVLDASGVYVVGKLIERARSIVEKEAADRRWGVGAELAPGQLSGWAITEQRLIARLLDLDSIGVRVTGSGMLVPQKSASIMVGVGPGYECSEVRSPCDYCDIGDTCRYKHREAAEQRSLGHQNALVGTIGCPQSRT